MVGRSQCLSLVSPFSLYHSNVFNQVITKSFQWGTLFLSTTHTNQNSYNDYGQLGRASDESFLAEVITAASSSEITFLSCGSAHTIIGNANNEIWGTGFNKYDGQLHVFYTVYNNTPVGVLEMAKHGSIRSQELTCH